MEHKEGNVMPRKFVIIFRGFSGINFITVGRFRGLWTERKCFGRIFIRKVWF
ncbi:hypothetical protein RchiOBHm_Chr6g0264691 [Rosa chinensis]|uniref:Uncharacterized protein n=1 Tax=Rosa chinensis TaxID=74649 RepID=A0A2P6PP73_ROSCH|nr:hypothetical protein RchiOBHm_Chr6g0264691 [Rosa chinensis]